MISFSSLHLFHFSIWMRLGFLDEGSVQQPDMAGRRGGGRGRGTGLTGEGGAAALAALDCRPLLHRVVAAAVGTGGAAGRGGRAEDVGGAGGRHSAGAGGRRGHSQHQGVGTADPPGAPRQRAGHAAQARDLEEEANALNQRSTVAPHSVSKQSHSINLTNNK